MEWDHVGGNLYHWSRFVKYIWMAHENEKP